VPPVRFHDLAGDGKPEARPGDAALVCISTEELREDAGLVLLGDANSLVTHLDPHCGSVNQAQDLDEAAVGGLLDGVPDQVPEHLGDPVTVGVHRYRLVSRSHADLVPVGRVGNELGLLREQLAQIERL